MAITLYQQYVPATGDVVTGHVTLTPVMALPVGVASLARVTRTVQLVAGAFSVVVASPGPYSVRENLANGVSKGFSGEIVVPGVGELGYRADGMYRLHDLIDEQTDYASPQLSETLEAKNAALAAEVAAEAAAVRAEAAASNALGLHEDPPGSGLFVWTEGALTEDPSNPGLYIVGGA